MFNTESQSSVKQFTRGGQTLLHNFRMFAQIANRAFIAVLLAGLLLTVLFGFVLTSPYERYVLKEWSEAKVLTPLNDTMTQSFRLPKGKVLTIVSKELLTDPAIAKMVNHAGQRLWVAFLYGLAVSLLGLCGVSYWLRVRGRSQLQDKHVRGDTLAEPLVVARVVKKANPTLSAFRIHNVPLPARAEYANFFLHGSVGTGKSETIKDLLVQIRRQGDRAIIFDKGCDFIRTFYQPEKDVLLNPLDERSRGWDLWADCEHPAHFDALAAAFIPMPIGAGVDPFWVNGARTIFAAGAYRLKDDPERSTLKLLKMLLTAELESLGDLLKGTEAESLVSDKISKTAISIKSVLATYLKSLKFLTQKENPFSIRQWVKDDTQSNWVFITSQSELHDTLKPLISGWLDIAANALTSLEPSQGRRIWVILDELPSLNQLPYLPSAVSEGRKFGGAFVLGLQSIAQLRKLYGPHGAEELSGLCNTRLFYRSPTSETAMWVSKELGQAEIEEMRENYSYGENSMRAGISVSAQTVQRSLVHYAEIMALPDLTCYLRLPGPYPVAKLKLSHVPRPAMNTAFVRASIKGSEEIQVVDKLLTDCQTQRTVPQTASSSDEEVPIRPKKPRKARVKKAPAPQALGVDYNVTL